MKALSIRQPWASLIVAGVKDIENRSWPTWFRGTFLVHAAKKVDEEGIKKLIQMGFAKDSLQSMRGYTGGIIGEVEVVDCVTESKSMWFEGPFGFVLKNARPLTFKPLKGMLGFFDVDSL